MIEATVFTAPFDCPHCERVKKVLTDYGFKYTEKVVTKDIAKEDLIAMIPEDKRPERLTVPQVFIFGRYIGTADMTTQYLEEIYGGLDDMA